MNMTSSGSLKRRAASTLRFVPESVVTRAAVLPPPWCKPARAALLNRDVRVRSGPAAGLRFNAGWNTADYALGTYEMPVQRAIVESISPGDVVFDVGANVGFFTALAARRTGRDGCVVAFEPADENADLIEHNASMNGFANVIVRRVAVASRTGTAPFLLSQFARGHALADADGTSDGTELSVVQTTSLDDAVASGDVPAPDFVKIDVEGAEMAVLDGMRQVLRTHRPTMLVEADDEDANRWNAKWDEIDDLLTDAGYHCRRLAPAYALTGWYVGHTLAVHPNASVRMASKSAR